MLVRVRITQSSDRVVDERRKGKYLEVKFSVRMLDEADEVCELWMSVGDGEWAVRDVRVHGQTSRCWPCP